MCVATPLKLASIDGQTGIVCRGGIEMPVRLDLLESVDPGDYVLVHAGYAIQVMDTKEAEELVALLEKLDDEPSN